MRLPKLTEPVTSKSITNVFAGYNHNLRIGEGEFYDMKNLTSDFYPVLSPRGQRGTYTDAENPLGLIAKDNLCYVSGSVLYVGGYAVPGFTLDPTSEKTLVSMGAYIVILPDKKYVNTSDFEDRGSIEASYGTDGEQVSVTFSLCRVDGEAFSDDMISSQTAPENPVDRQYWIDTSSKPHALKQYSAKGEAWVTIATTYVKISAPGIGKNFERYDGVTVSGLNGKTGRDDLDAIDGSFAIWERGDDYIVILGFLDEQGTVDVPITVKRSMPDMDFVIESENRLWGCKYGIVDGKPVNGIYASKLGDFKNWNCFMGLSVDSYAASVGTDGAFTGAFTYLGYPLFFKEGFVHKVFGNYPSNYQIQTTACRGVQNGCGKSLAMVNETLFYKAKTGVCAYDGSLPCEISGALGETAYRDAVACAHGNKYYISMADEQGLYSLFVFDVPKAMWHKEDDLCVAAFCSCRSELYYIEHGKSGIKTMFGSGTRDTGEVRWMAQTGAICVDDIIQSNLFDGAKYISGMSVRMSLEIGSSVSVFVQYDSFGEWEHVGTYTASALRNFSFPITPRRCSHFKLRIEGVGDAKIYSVSKTIERGSDMG